MLIQRFARFPSLVTAMAAVAVLLSGCGGSTGARQPADATHALRDAPLDDDPLTSPRTEWFRQGKFGMFIHWGVYAVPAGVYKGKEVGGIGEWIMDRGKIPIPEYETFAKQFNPTRFNAKEWVRIAKDAGMTYMVITSKHHDGFCMWPSQFTEYDIADATPFTRDPLKELAQACREAGIKLSFYHSIMDWHHPDAKGDAIYGTTASPWTKHPFDGRCTLKDSTLYVHVFSWDGPVRLIGIKGEVVKAEPLDTRLGAAKYEVTSADGVQVLTLHAPETPDLIATVIAVHFKEAPQVDPALAFGLPVKQAPEGSIVLVARDAAVHGEKAKYESGGGKDNIGFWTNAGDWVSWTANVTKPGTFTVEITYAADTASGGSEYVVAVGDRQVAGKIAATGSWTAFKAETLGKVTIEKAGKITVSVTPKTKPGMAVMNLKSLILKPAKE